MKTASEVFYYYFPPTFGPQKYHFPAALAAFLEKVLR